MTFILAVWCHEKRYLLGSSIATKYYLLTLWKSKMCMVACR